VELKKIVSIGKGKLIPLIGVCVGILIILFGGILPGESTKNNKKGEDYYEVSFYTEALEERIEELCTTIGGITEARVLLTLDCGTEYIYGQNIKQSGMGETISYSTDYIILNRDNTENPVLVMEIYPKIRGIAVVCTNGEDIMTQQKVIELLSAALGISSNRIKVAGT